MGCKQLSYYREATVTEDTPFVAVHRGEKTKTLKKSSIGAITGSTGASNYEGAIRSSLGSRGSMISGLFGDQIDDSRPRAFINLIFLPSQAGTSIQNNHFAFTQVSNASDNTHAALRLSEYEAPASGFIVLYLSNESRKLTEVYFDDLKITVSESKVVQRDDYYPFGLSFNSWKRSTARENKYLYQGKEQQDDLDLGTFDFHARMYDPLSSSFATRMIEKSVSNRHLYKYFYKKNGGITDTFLTNPRCKRGLCGSPYFPSAMANILTEITYPTGGKSKFVYEGNGNGGGIQIKKIISTSGVNNQPPLIRSFTYEKSSNFGVPKYSYQIGSDHVENSIYIPIFNFTLGITKTCRTDIVIGRSTSFNHLFDLNGYQVGYGEVTEKFDNGKEGGYIV